MGCKGNLAEEYAALVVELHKKCYRHLAPRFFKDMLAQFAPQFSGYQQQDAQVSWEEELNKAMPLTMRCVGVCLLSHGWAS